MRLKLRIVWKIRMIGKGNTKRRLANKAQENQKG